MPDAVNDVAGAERRSRRAESGQERRLELSYIEIQPFQLSLA